MPRANVLEGFTTKIKCGCGSLYVTLNKNEKGELSEVFLNLGKSGTCGKSYMELLGRMMTHVIRKDVDIRKVIKSIKGIQCMQASEDSLSCANAIAHALEIYLQKKEGKESKEVPY